ncbi:PadR family transcriptional regulator [Staphylococcus warneri]|uniref:PadR family transcriptional regulator n=1 Tax=Staphylococcus warneri TaxID=1292 RepID=UPI00066A9CE9|nr:PadR family transcriptional regulator [Staphylococcus warneri]MBY6178485.1 PadR family transcriptional regulator [Staphylococcaceae bacterium DP2N0-1]RQM97669.1 PadR family transcriptional regulator [Staphylococcus warneri]
MKRYKLLPLSETMHYILLALVKPAHGYKIMQQVNEMSNGDVNIAAGTLYGALENLQKNGYICMISESKARRKVYQITQLGKEILEIENDRLRRMVNIYESGSDQIEKND